MAGSAGGPYPDLGSSDRRWDDQNLDQLKRIPGSAFEVVRSAAPAHAC